MKKSIVMLCLVVLVCLSVSSNAALVFKITSDDTTLTVGQTTTMHVWGWADDPLATGTNGLVVWETNLSVDNGGIVEITKSNGTDADITLIAPTPFSPYLNKYWDAGSVNVPNSGQVSKVTMLCFPDDMSSTGIGTGDGNRDNAANYAELFRFTIQAIDVGTVSYSIVDMWGDLADGITFFDASDGSSIFYSDGSGNVLTIIPEPSTLILLSGFGITGFLSRRKK